MARTASAAAASLETPGCPLGSPRCEKPRCASGGPDRRLLPSSCRARLRTKSRPAWMAVGLASAIAPAISRARCISAAGSTTWCTRPYSRASPARKMRPRQGQLGRAPLAHRRRHRPEDHERPQPDADFREPESGILGRHHDMAIRRQAGAAGQRRAMHRRDQRLGHADSRRKDALVDFIDIARRRATALRSDPCPRRTICRSR